MIFSRNVWVGNSARFHAISSFFLANWWVSNMLRKPQLKNDFFGKHTEHCQEPPSFHVFSVNMCGSISRSVLMRSLSSFLQIDALGLRFKRRDTRGSSLELIPDIFKNRQVFMVFPWTCVGQYLGQFWCDRLPRSRKLMHSDHASEAATREVHLWNWSRTSSKTAKFLWFFREHVWVNISVSFDAIA